jgi:Protein of unknown function (DUF5663)/Helicase HerA, central domain/TraM recognition site of TraD and TraG
MRDNGLQGAEKHVTEGQPASAQEVPNHVLRIAVVQLDYTPNTETLAGKRWLPDEPLIDWLHQEQRAPSDYSIRSGAIDAHPTVRSRTEIVLSRARKLRDEQLNLKLKQILEFCVRQGVDLVVFPEALIPTSLIPVLVRGYRSKLAVFAGVGTIRPRDVKELQEIGFESAERELGSNAAVYVDREQLKLVTKRERAPTEVMEPGSGTARVVFHKGGRLNADGTVAGGTAKNLGLAICRDYVNAPRTFDDFRPMPDIVLVTALTPPTDDFLRTPRNFAVAFANHASQGGSAIMMTPLVGFFVDSRRRGTEPLSPGESIVVADYEGFRTAPTPTVEPSNRQVCRAAVVYDSPSPGDPAGSPSSLARQLRDLTLEGLNYGEYDSLLSVAEDRLQAMSIESNAVLLSAVRELRRNASTLVSRSDLALFTNHLVVTDVRSEVELRYEILGNLRREWFNLFSPDSDQSAIPEGVSAFLERAISLRKALLPLVRLPHRDSPLSDRKGEGRSRTAESPHRADGFTTFYSARLGPYEIERAVRSLELQLGALRTIAASEDTSVRLIYQLSTAMQTSGHLEPFFDVIGVTESADEDILEDLREGVGQQLSTAYRSSWDVSVGPATGTLKYESIAELRLARDAVPKIREDWATLVDYLRSLAVPVTVQLTCHRVPEQSSPPAEEHPHLLSLNALLPLTGLAGFFFSSERDAAAFLERTHREEAGTSANLGLMIHVGSADPLPESVLRAIGQWLFHAMPFEIIRGGPAKERLTADSSPRTEMSLLPSEILRVFHPPYGQMEGRGLDRQRTRSIPVPVTALSPDGLLLGQARVEGTRQDQWLDVRMDSSSRLRHVYVVGATGSGKTTLLKNLARQDIQENRGVAVIDPHGDLVDYLVKHTSGRDDNVLLLDFGDPDYLPVLNPLDLDVDSDSPNDQNLAIEGFLKLLVRQSHHTFYGPRFESMCRLVLASTTNPNFPFQPPSVLDIGAFLRDEDSKHWLQSLLQEDRNLSQRWRTFDRQGGNDFAELLDWALAKFSEMEQDGTLRYVLASGRSTVSLRRVVEGSGILLVKIPEWEMSASAAAFLGGFIQEQVRRAIYRRYRRAEEAPPPYYMYVDEFQNFSLGGFEEIVAEARKFGLGLILAHQNFDQLEAFSQFTGSSSRRLRNAVISNTANRFVFGLSNRDANELADDLGVDGEALRSPGTYRATAQVLFDNRQHTFTLATYNADSDAGLPDQYDAIRQRMIDLDFWRRRDELREQDVDRAERMKAAVLEWKSSVARGHRAPNLDANQSPVTLSDFRADDDQAADIATSWSDFLRTYASNPDTQRDAAFKFDRSAPAADVRDSDDVANSDDVAINYNALDIDEALLTELGLSGVLAEHTAALIKFIEEVRELRVGAKLSSLMSAQQVAEFEELIDEPEEEGKALDWLNANLPGYESEVRSQWMRLKEDLREVAADLVEISQKSSASGSSPPGST